MAENKFKKELINDLKSLQTYLSKYNLDSYYIIACSDANNFWYTWNFDKEPNLLLSLNEICNHQLKTNIVNTLQDATKEAKAPKPTEDRLASLMLDNIKYNSKLN